MPNTLQKIISFPASHNGQPCIVSPEPTGKPCNSNWAVNDYCDIEPTSIYFSGNYGLGDWDDPRNWWMDSSHTIPYLTRPPSNEPNLIVTVDSPVTQNSGPIPTISKAIFNASNSITINGNAEFRGQGSVNTGTINGNVKVVYPATAPIGGTITGEVEYINFPTPPIDPTQYYVATPNNTSNIKENQVWTMNATFIGDCNSRSYNFLNTSNHYLYYSIAGVVDDDIEINGNVYENGKYPYFFPDPPCGRVNGAHSFSYPLQGRIGLNVGRGFIVRALNNGGYGGINATISTFLTPV